MKKYTTAVDTVLLKATDFSIVNNKIYFKNEQTFWIYTVPSNTIAKLLTIDYVNKSSQFDIYALNFANDDIIIGTYKTKERALEVLDEIQDLLQNAYAKNVSIIVYQMPEN